MHVTADQHRQTGRRGDLAEDVAILLMMFSGAILVVGFIVAAFVSESVARRLRAARSHDDLCEVAARLRAV